MSALEAWRGEFGDAYVDRNQITPAYMAQLAKLWADVIGVIPEKPKTIVEVGANIGANLRALRSMTDAEVYGIEPNHKARAELWAAGMQAVDGTAANIPMSNGRADLVFTCGVLIHVPPEDLAKSCSEIYRVSSKYIACVEYFSDQPREVPYRGNDGLMFERDFGGFWLDQYPNLKLLGNGFCWKRSGYPDNVNWWVFEKGPALRVAPDWTKTHDPDVRPWG